MKLFSCLNQMIMKFILLINIEMPGIVGVLTLINGQNKKNGLNDPHEDSLDSGCFGIHVQFEFDAQLS